MPKVKKAITRMIIVQASALIPLARADPPAFSVSRLGETLDGGIAASAVSPSASWGLSLSIPALSTSPTD